MRIDRIKLCLFTYGLLTMFLQYTCINNLVTSYLTLYSIIPCMELCEDNFNPAMSRMTKYWDFICRPKFWWLYWSHIWNSNNCHRVLFKFDLNVAIGQIHVGSYFLPLSWMLVVCWIRHGPINQFINYLSKIWHFVIQIMLYNVILTKKLFKVMEWNKYVQFL